RTDNNSISFGLRANTEPKPKAKLITVNWSGAGDVNYDWRGRVTNIDTFTDVAFSLQRNTSIAIQPAMSYEALHEDEFGLARTPTRPGAFTANAKRAEWQKQLAVQLNSSPT